MLGSGKAGAEACGAHKIDHPDNIVGRHAGGCFTFAYSTNYLIDIDNAIIVDIEATTAIRQAEVLAVKRMNICQAGSVFARKQEALRRDRMILYVARDCTDCSPKPRCTTAKRRFVSRHLHEDALERMNSRFHAEPSLIRQRRCASEHPFGTIKRMTAGGRFLTRGIKKASAEAAPCVLAYNIIRTINLIGADTLRRGLA